MKSDLGISGSGSDTKLNRLIVAASLTLAGPEGLNRDPWLQTYLEKMPGPDGIYLRPTHWPIQSITSITSGTGSSPSTVTGSTYSVRGDRRTVYRVNEWARTGWDTTPRLTGARALEYNVTYLAGWVMPDQATEWAAATAFAASSWAKATDDDEPFVFQMDATGVTTGSTEPTWPTVSGGTVTEESQTWTAYDQRLPQPIEEAAIITVIDWFRGGLDIPAGIASEGGEGWRIVYRDGVSGLSVPLAAQSLCRPYREPLAA